MTIKSERENQFVFEMFAKDKTNANDPGSNLLLNFFKIVFVSKK